MNPTTLRRARTWVAAERQKAAVRGLADLLPIIDEAGQAVVACMLAAEEMRTARAAKIAHPDTQLSGEPSVAPTQWHGAWADTALAATQMPLTAPTGARPV